MVERLIQEFDKRSVQIRKGMEEREGGVGASVNLSK